MILKIIAIDATSQEECQNLIDEYHNAGLINNCLSVDLSDPQNWRACYPDEEYTDLVSCLNRGLWTKMVVLSLRGKLSSGTPDTSRVAAEVQLRAFLQSRYDSTVGLECFTLSQLGSSINESMFPQNYLANYLHQPDIDVDPRQAKIDVNDSNINQVLVFTALTIVGAGKWVASPVWHDIEDKDLGSDRLVRFVRVQTRVGVCGPLVANLVKAAVRPGGGAIPAGLAAGLFVAVNEEPNELRKLSDSFIEKYRFKVMKRALTDGEKDTVVIDVPWWKAIQVFFKGFGRYLRSAVVAEWQDRVDSLTRPLLSRLQDITFGDDSTIVIKGVRHEISSDALARFAEELKNRLDGLDGVTAPNHTPDVWQGLLQTSFALLDGSDFPNQSEESPVPIHVPVSTGKRIVFMQPAIVGPDLTDDLFTLSPADCEVLDLDRSRARSVGMFENYEAERLGAEVNDAVSRAKFRADVEILSRDRASMEVPEASSTSRLRGSLTRTERIEAAKAESGKSAADVSPKRTSVEIGKELAAWLTKRETLSRDSFIAHLFESLDNSIEHEVSSLKWEALIKEIDELIKPIEAPKLRFKRILKIFGLLLIPLVIAAVLFSTVIGAVTAVLGIPLLVFVLISWGTSFGFALCVAIFKRALALRRLEFKKQSQASEIERKYRDLVHSINEFRRLQLLKVQFADWQRLVRELVHYPYGRIDEMGEVLKVIDGEAIPPQFVIARLESSPSQAMELRNFAHSQLKVSGYLGAIAVSLRNDWREEYESIEELRMQPNPELDVTPAGIEPGVEVRGRRYLFARRDFIESSITGTLRAEMVSDRVRELSENIHSRQVSEVLSTVDAGSKPAFSTDTPIQFLEGLTRQVRSGFSIQHFDPGHLGNDGVQELDENFSFLTEALPTLGGFLVSLDEPQMLLASTRVDIGKPFTPNRLKSYSARGEDEPGSGRRPIDGPPV
jgi:hypothetical protein